MVRIKNRYLLFNILYPAPPTGAVSSVPSPLDFLDSTPSGFTASNLAALVRDQVALQFGDHGAGVAGSLSVKYFSPVTSTGIIRVAREHYRLVWAALTFIQSIKGREVVIRVVKVSGTIRKAELEAVRRAKGDIQRIAGKDAVDGVLEGMMASAAAAEQMDVEDDDDGSEMED